MAKKTISKSWWGQRFMEALAGFTDPNRLKRGRSYASSTRIKTWAITANTITAKIRGNVNPYFGVYKEPTYDTAITVVPIKAADWNEIIRALSQRASFIVRLLMNEMPDDIETPFQELDLRLLPNSRKDLRTKCSCPDYENPCKHIAGLYYFVAAQLDQDPFLLFELRGLSREKLQVQLRKSPLGLALAQSLNEQDSAPQFADSYFTRPARQALQKTCAYQDFWHGSKRLPGTIEPAAPAAVPAILVKKAGDSPGFWTKDESFIAVMEEFYGRVRDRL